MNRIIFQPDGTPMVPIFSPRRRLYEALYEPEAIIPLFHYSNCERSELSSLSSYFMLGFAHDDVDDQSDA